MITLEQLGAKLLAGYGCGRILIVRVQTGLELLYLGRRKGCRLRIFSRNAVPNVFRELDSLGHGKIKKIGFWLAREWILDRRALSR